MKPTVYTFILIFVLTFNAFSQQDVTLDSTEFSNLPANKTKPNLNYAVGSSFIFIPKFGSATGVNASAFLAYPLTSRLSVQGGLSAGRYFTSFRNDFRETGLNNSFNTLSLYGLASYKVNDNISLYSIGTKQLAGSVPLYNSPGNSISFGSEFTYGNLRFSATIKLAEYSHYVQLVPWGSETPYLPVLNP
jgi:hypothetical protein